VSAQIGAHDRRYFVLEVSGARMGDGDYWQALYNSINTAEFHGALLAFLLERDISAYHCDKPPMTALKAEI
jgi:hypothetical protein